MTTWRAALGGALVAVLMVGCGDGMTTGDGGTGGGSSTSGGGTGTTTGGGTGTTGGGTGTTGGGTGTTTGDIVAVASADTRFTTLVAALQKAGLVSALQAATPKKTVFAPTNEAFAALLTELGAGSLDDLTADQLKPILLYHVLGTEIRSAAATTAATANMKVDSLGGKIQLGLMGTNIRLDARATITVVDVNASNGVIHAIDKVLLPSIADIATTTPAVSSLVAALALADTGTPSPGLVAALDNDAAAKVTVFAPVNDGFTALITALGANSGITALSSFRPDQVAPILKYHVATARYLASAVPTTATKIDTMGGKLSVQRTGNAVTADGVSVVTANLLASNGVIHVIGSVLLPSIADIATTTPAVSSLVAALALADTGTPSPNLVTTLDNDASATKFTVFAPTNEAFTALVTALGAPAGISALTDFRPDNVLPVLTYHVAGASYFAAQVPTAATAIDTLGGKVTVQRTGNAVTVDGVSVAAANLFASNGVIHVIGSVLVPSITDVVTTSARFTSLRAAVLAADGAANTNPKIATVLDGTAKFTLFAPSNAAFTTLGAGAPSGQALTNVLAYHAVPGNPVYAAAALALTAPLVANTAFTVNNNARTISIAAEGTAPNKTVTVADSTATKANVNAVNFFTSNGVIHQVDKVLIPVPAP